VNGRILRIELGRSVAPWAGGLFLVAALAFLHLVNGPWWKGDEAWTAQWTSTAWWERFALAFLWPLVVGAGAVQGLRDHRSGMRELLATTPRPAWHRAAKAAGASALALTAAYLLLFLVGAVQVIGNDGYFHVGWVPIVAVGVLGVVAGALLGMGVARLVPSALTPPVLAVAALAVTVYVAVIDARADGGSGPEGALANRITLLAPALPPMRDVFLTVAGRVNLGQAVWLLGLAGTGFLLLTAATRRSRLLALLPVVLGAAVALPVLPYDPAGNHVPDSAATAPVCEGRVCVTKLHSTRLAALAGPGREALRLLAVLPDAPVSVHESPGTAKPVPDGAVPVDLDAWEIRGATGEELTRSLLAGAGTAACSEYDTRELAARTVAAAWFLGDLEPLHSHRMDPLSGPAWNALRALPAGEQRATGGGAAGRGPVLRGRPAGRTGGQGDPVRWGALYARSRQVPASLATVLIGVAAVWALTQATDGRPGDPRTAALVLTAAVAVAAAGLSGQDHALDRTAAFGWVPRRAAHVLLSGAVTGSVLPALHLMGDELAPTGFIVRDAAGLTGLVAIGAAAFGGRFGWTLPFGWLSAALFVPPSAGGPAQVATWMLQPPGTTAATWTSLVLAAAGTLAYALAGPRR
jgi:hypothetical protein